MSQLLESIWTKDDVVSFKSLTSKIIANDWDSLKLRHELGVQLLKKRAQYRLKASWGQQLKILSDQLQYNSQELRRYIMFAFKFQNFEAWKQKYPEPPSWHAIVNDDLYEASEDSHGVTQYARKVLNLTNDDPRDRFIFYYFPKVCDENECNESEAMRNAIILWMESNSKKYKPSQDSKLQQLENKQPTFQY